MRVLFGSKNGSSLYEQVMIKRSYLEYKNDSGMFAMKRKLEKTVVFIFMLQSVLALLCENLFSDSVHQSYGFVM